MREFIVFAFCAFTFSLQAKSVISVDDLHPKNGDLGTAISEAIDNVSKKNDEIEVVFSKGKTYTFYRSIVVRDHTAIDGNGCIIRFNTQPQTHAMYIYNSFITNRKCVSTDGNINHFTRTLYATKDITVQNINFECEGDNEFWFNVNSERGIIGLSGVDGLKIENNIFVGGTSLYFAIHPENIHFGKGNVSFLTEGTTLWSPYQANGRIKYSSNNIKDVRKKLIGKGVDIGKFK